MTQPFIGEIQIYGFNFNPRGWAYCNGATLPIQQNTALFSLLGTTYGGNGTTTFMLPNLASRAARGEGSGPGLSPAALGQTGGSTSVTLTTNQIPAHTHTLNSATLNTPNPAQNVATPGTTAMFGLSGPNNTYSDTTTPNTTFNPATLSSVWSGGAHENMQPYLGVNFCIALQGIYPARN